MGLGGFGGRALELGISCRAEVPAGNDGKGPHLPTRIRTVKKTADIRVMVDKPQNIT